MLSMNSWDYAKNTKYLTALALEEENLGISLMAKVSPAALELQITAELKYVVQ